MEWLALFGLFVWTAIQSNRLSDLRGRLARTEAQLDRLQRSRSADRDLVDPRPAEAPAVVRPAPVGAPPEPSLARSEPGPSTPAEAPSPAEAFDPAEALEPTWASDLESSTGEPRHAPSSAPPAPGPLRPPPPRSDVRLAKAGVPIDRWLAENGLAWLGGGALALGAAFLVGYAAQQGVFTPMLRVIAGGLLGAVLIAVSEWIRRAKPEGRWRHPLAAAACAGAGAAALYASVWAAHGLYSLIPTAAAAVLLAAISAGLLGLSFLHGQALAALAMFGAFAAPLATGAEKWTFGTLTLLLTATVAAGFGAARLRRWVAPAVITVLGGLGWSALGVLEGGAWRAAGLLLLTAAGAVAAFGSRSAARDEPADWVEARPKVSGLALAGAALIAGSLWVRAHEVQGGAALLGVLVLSAAAVWLCRLPGVLLAGPAALATAAGAFGPEIFADAPQGQGWVVAWAAALGLGAAVAGRLARDRGADMVGAAGSALLLAVYAAVTSRFDATAASTIPALGAGALLAVAFVVSRREPEPSSSLAVDAWASGATAATLVACTAALDARGEGIAYAAVALGCAGARLATGWRAWPWAALLTAGVSLAGFFQRDFFAPAVSGGSVLTLAVGAPLGAALLLAGAALVLRRGRANSEVVQAMISAAAIAVLLAVFLLLRRIAERGGALDGLTEAGLQALALLAAGLISARAGARGMMAGLRTHGLLVIGGGWALLAAGLVANPWWGLFRAPVAGPPLLDSLSLAALAPAVLLAAAAALLYRRVRPAGRVYAAGAVALGMLWAVLEVRRLFHPDKLDAGLIGPLEGLIYGLILLAVPVAVLALVRAGRLGSAASNFDRAARGGTWAGLGLSIAAAWLVYNPWWGSAAQPYDAGWQPAGGLLVVAACAALCAWLGRATPSSVLRTAGVASSVAFLFLIPTLTIRWGFQGLDQRFGLASDSVENWSYSAAWAVFGLAALALGSARSGTTLRRAGLLVLLVAACKVFLFDMATLTGVLRAASFLGLGVVLMAGAIAARRLGVLPGRARDASPEPEQASL